MLQDIGSPAISGVATTASGGFDFSAGGSDIGASGADQFSFNYMQQSGDFDVKVRLAAMSLSDAWAKAGLMAREDLMVSNRYAATIATPGVSGCFFQARLTNGRPATVAGSFPVTYPSTWLRLQRQGNSFTGYASVDGNAWAQLGVVTLALSNTVYLGVAATSRNTNQPTVVQVRDFQNVAGGTTASLALGREPIGPSSRKTGLAISEIMYHPRSVPGFSNSLEFIEIYNSQGFFEKIGGYRISGSVNYTFPSNTVMPSGAYVVVARDPAFLQSHYGISGVLGPWDGADTNSLPATTGTVQLRNRQGAVLLEVIYEGKSPWPTAADGAGHSLVLARPSYGEGDPRAWAASDSLDGSPGRDDPYNTEPLRSVAINEVFAHSDDSLSENFVELYNHNNQPADLSGVFLSDDAAIQKFRIPDGTIISPTGFVFFTQSTLGFGLSALGGRVFLVNSNQTRVIDAVGYEAQASGFSAGRFPEGAGPFRELASRTPGAPNSNPLLRDIVINEIMHSPISGNNNDEYIELYNKGTNTVNLANWIFTAGISFSFPSNTSIAPDGYLVVAKNKTNLFAHHSNLNATNTVGNFVGGLAGGGERIALSMPAPWVIPFGGGFLTNIIYVVENEVTYGKGGRWGTWSGGGGSSLELVDPRSDNRQPANWADSDETHKSQWTNFEWTGPLGETLGSPINDNVQIVLMGIGECLIDEVELHNGAGANLIANPGFEQGSANWVFQGSHDFSSIENEGYAGSKSLHVRAGSRGDNGGNRIRTTALSTSAAGTVTLRAKARWLRGWPEVLLRIHGGGAEVVGVMSTPSNLGTPGARNSQAVLNAGPAVFEVQHSPVLPAANEPVVVTARAFDPDGISSLMLKYRIDPSANYVSLPMLDDGTGGDAVAGDGLYSATLPGQAAGGTIAFYIQAVDNLNATNLFPQDVFPKAPLNRCFPNDSITREGVLRWGDVQMPGSFATYHLWLTYANSNRWAFRGHPPTENPNTSGLDNAEMDGTFVYNNARAVYNALPLYAGSPWHRGQMTTGPCGVNRVDFVMNFPADDRMLGTTDFVLNNPGNPGGTTTSDTSAQTEQTSYIIFNEIGLVYNHRRYIHYFINGSQRSTTADRPGNFIFEDSQQPNGDVVHEWYPNDASGELYKIEDWFEFNDNGYDFSDNNDADLSRRTINGSLYIAPYRFMFRKRSLNPGDSTTNYTNFFALVNAASPTAAYSPTGPSKTAPIPDLALFDSIANYEQWMRIFAVQRTVGNWDSYGYSRGKNDYTWKGVNGRFEQLTWDIDFTMGVGGNGAGQSLFDSVSDPRVIGMYSTPAIVRACWRAFQDIVDGPLNNAFLDPILDAKAAALTLNRINIDPNTLATVKTYTSQRRAFILTQLATVAASFSLSPTNYATANTNLLILSGAAPIIIKNMTAIFNNVAYPIPFTGVTNWSIRLVLSPGENQIVIQSFDRFGNELTGFRRTNNVNYVGPVVAPQEAIVFNEIMYNPTATNASYIEIFNNSDAAFDVSSWRLDGLDYVFPSGSVLAARSYLTLAKSTAAFAAAYGLKVPVFGQFNGQLNTAGQTIALIKPGATPLDDLVVDEVRYEASLPWALGANGQGAALQLIDPSQDNSRVSNWADGSAWRLASITGVIGVATNVLIYLAGPGEVYIDDVSITPLSGPSSGINLLQDGDFESDLAGSWIVPATMSGSALSSAYAHSTNYSLHVVATNSGSVANSIHQNLPVLDSNTVCTLSFWYRTINSTNLTIRAYPGGLSLNVNPRPIGFTPSSSNSTLASLPPYPLLWLNEVQANNISGPVDGLGERDPWIELYNASTNVLPLEGFYLANNYTNLTQWAFPAGSVINPGQFLLVWADGQPNQSTSTQWHTSFRLADSTGSVALVRLVGALPQIMDYLNYSGLAADQSYGDYPDGQPFDRQIFAKTTTPGTNNYALPSNVLINEWIASNAAGSGGYPDPTDGHYDDWFELYNPSPQAANIGGLYLTGNLTNQLAWRIPNGTSIPAGGYLLVWADQNNPANSPNGDLHVNFKLAKSGDSIGLFALVGTNIIQVDAVTFGPQNTDVSQGRYPDGAPGIYFLSTPTPRAPNAVPGNSPPVLQAIGDRVIDELTRLRFTAVATDSDTPPQTLTFSLDPGAPAGASISPSGAFKWRPSERQGPGLYHITVRVTDDGTPTLSATQTFSVTVNEVNSAPSFIDVRDKYVKAGALLSFLTGVDSDWPTQNLAFSLEAGAAQGAAIDPVSGLFSWTPTDLQAPGTYSVAVHVIDDGVPPLSADTAYIIHVLERSATLILMNWSRSGSAVALNWQTTVGKAYQVEYKDHLNQASWIPLGSSQIATSNTLSITDNFSPTSQRFYHVVLVP